MAINYINSETNKRKPIDKIYLFTATFAIMGILFIASYYTSSRENIASILIGSFSCLLFVMLQYYFICPLQLRFARVLFFLFAEGVCILSVGLFYYFLFERGVLVYSDYVHANLIPIETKLTFFLIVGALIFYAAHFLYLFFNTYQLSEERLKHLINSYSKEINKLRMQSNPYFLFTYLNNTGNLLKAHEVNKALDYNASIFSLLNKQLAHSHSEHITLEEELLWIRNYMDTEQLISEKSFIYNIEIQDDELLLQLLPPFLLQPILESFIHKGLTGSDGVSISIAIRDMPDAVHNGIQLSVSSSYNQDYYPGYYKKHVSVINLEKRIALINNLKKFNLSIREFAEHDRIYVELSITEFTY